MTEYEKFLQELETFILWKINRRKWILFCSGKWISADGRAGSYII